MSAVLPVLDARSGRPVLSVEQPPERDLNDFHYFALVVRHRGFGAASRASGIPKSRLSRRVRELERRLGALLLQRSTSRFEVTPIGQMFFARCEAALAEIEAAETAAQFYIGEPRGLLRVSTPPGDCAEAVANMLPAFLGDYPHVRVELVVAMRRIDIISEQVDVAIRVRTRLDSEQDLVVKQLMTLRALVVAAPSLLAARGEPHKLEDLARFPTLANGSGNEWSLVDAAGLRHTHRHNPVAAADDLPTVVRLCESGLGLAMIPEAVAKSVIDAGRLKHVLTDCRSDESILHLAFPTRRGMLPSVRMFIDRASAALVTHFGAR